MLEIFNMEQGSEEWHMARKGCISASNFHKVLSKGTARDSYMYEVAAGVMSMEIPQSYTNAAMQWGTDTEPQARAMYSLVTGRDVAEIGMAKIGRFVSCSPDGLVEGDGLVEFKCPNTATHIRYITKGKLPSQYKAQVQGQMYVMDKKWCDFVSFDPRISGEAQMFIVRVERDDEYINKLKGEISIFEGQLIDILTGMGWKYE